METDKKKVDFQQGRVWIVSSSPDKPATSFSKYHNKIKGKHFPSPFPLIAEEHVQSAQSAASLTWIVLLLLS